MSTEVQDRPRRRFPPWLRKRIPADGDAQRVRALLKDLRLATVCQSARCPNLCECFSRGTATFMILGSVCSRNCRFCAVPNGPVSPPEADEPDRVAEATSQLELKHVVVTSVTRDDLADGGAEQFRRTILAIKARTQAHVEVLTPDFQGNKSAIAHVASANPNVYNHNVETIERLYPDIRPEANYRRSLDLLGQVARDHPSVLTKSGIMVGLGETRDEVLKVLRDLRAVGCALLTVGQYLQPTPTHAPIARFVPPEEFADYEQAARGMGFAGAASGPFVRSSYNAGALFENAGCRKTR